MRIIERSRRDCGLSSSGSWPELKTRWRTTIWASCDRDWIGFATDFEAGMLPRGRENIEPWTRWRVRIRGTGWDSYASIGSMTSSDISSAPPSVTSTRMNSLTFSGGFALEAWQYWTVPYLFSGTINLVSIASPSYWKQRWPPRRFCTTSTTEWLTPSTPSNTIAWPRYLVVRQIFLESFWNTTITRTRSIV